jgi:hypothetical protein
MSNAASTKQIDNTPSLKTSLSLIIHGGSNQICVDTLQGYLPSDEKRAGWFC